MNKLIRLSFVCSIFGILSACGGGGSSSGGTDEPLSVNGNTRANSRADQCLLITVTGVKFNTISNSCGFEITVVDLGTGGGVILGPNNTFSADVGGNYAACEAPFRPNPPSGSCIG